MHRRSLAIVLLWLSAACAPAPSPLDADAAGDAGLDAAVPTDAARDADALAPGDAEVLDASADAAATPDAGPDPFPVVDALVALRCAVRAHAECHAPWTCACPGFGPPPADPDACERTIVASCTAEADRSALAGLVRRAALRVDDARLAECRRTAERAFDLCQPPRRDFFATYRACLHALGGSIPIGRACSGDGLCADGEGRCDGTTCLALPALGAPCTTLCTAPAACVGGTCAEPVARGGACTDDEDCAAPEPCIGGVCGAGSALGEACRETPQCALGLRCEVGRCAPGVGTAPCALGGSECGAGTTCQPALQRRCLSRGELGARCASDDACLPELVCSGRPARPGVCRTPPGPGEPCFERCAEGAVCAHTFEDPTGLCEVAPGLGAPCDSAWAFTSCAPGLVCDAFAAVCKTIPGLGEPCEGVCSVGLGCDFTQRPALCVPALREGESCDGSVGTAECAPDLACDTSVWPWVCRPTPTSGESCGWSGGCAAGFDCRAADASESPVCVPRSSLGGACGIACVDGAYCDHDFSSGLCARDVCGRLPRPSPR